MGRIPLSLGANQIMGRIPLSLGANNASIIISNDYIMIMFDYFPPIFIRAIFIRANFYSRHFLSRGLPFMGTFTLWALKMCQSSSPSSNLNV
jgi:hypothetical protein